MFAGIASVDKSPSPFQHQTQILIYKAEIIIKSQMRAIALKLSFKCSALKAPQSILEFSSHVS